MADHDFRIEIGTGGSEGYEVILRTPDGGEASSIMRLTVTDKQLDMLAARIPAAVIASSVTMRSGMRVGEQPVRQLGTLLFDSLLGEAGRSMLIASRNQAVREGRRLRMVLQIRPPELARLPWEFMFDSRDDEYVCLRNPMIRYPLSLTPVLPMEVSPPLRILGMVARPADLGALATADEVARLDSALKDLVRDGQVELEWAAGQGWRDLQEAMWHGPWHVFHFIGHGAVGPAGQEGSIALVDDDSSTYHLGAKPLARLLGDHRPLRLVVLNACETDRANVVNPFSSVARTLMRNGAPAVLAMQNVITDQAAIEFSRAFYAGLAALRPVDLAVMDARQAIHLALKGSLEWGTPVLHMRSAGGGLFARVGAVAATPAQASHHHAPAEHAGVPNGGVNTRPADSAHVAGQSARSEAVRDKLVEVAAIRAPGQVNAVAFNAEGTRLAFACDGRSVLVVDEIGRERLRVRHGASVVSVSDVAVDPAAGLLLATTEDKTACIWDMTTGGLTVKVSHADTARRVVFSPDGHQLATGSVDKTARIWDASTGSQLMEFPHGGNVLALAFSPDGQLLATASGDTAWLWATASGSQLRYLTHSGTVRAVAFSPGGELLATASTDGTARIWDPATGSQLAEIRHAGSVRSVAFSPRGGLLAAGGQDRIVHLWQVVKDSDD